MSNILSHRLKTSPKIPKPNALKSFQGHLMTSDISKAFPNQQTLWQALPDLLRRRLVWTIEHLHH